MILGDDDLTLPHPFAHQRAFVLVPWLDVDPDATLPVSGEHQPVRKLLAELDPAESRRGASHRPGAVPDGPDPQP